MQRILFATFFWMAAAVWVFGQAPNTRVSLIHAENQVKAGDSILVGIRFQLPAGWHLYWTNPGDAGQPPSVQWRLPFGWKAGDLQWPTPARLVNPAGVDYGYENEVTLLTPIKVGQMGGDVVADLRWLVCKDVCVPQKGQAKTTVRMGNNSINPAAKQVIDTARENLPKTMPTPWKVNAFQNPTQVVLNFRPGTKVMHATFFPEERDVIENAAPQKLSSTSYAAQVSLKKADGAKKISRLKGVLVVNEADAYAVDVAVK
jgi:thiol:disulfide interchange protein DsbD